MTENNLGNKMQQAWLLLIFLLGTYLRLWHWPSQMMLDDEWHALNFVFNRSFFDVILQQGLGANSIPVNIYAWLVLNTTGWSEPLLRLPSMLSGIAALVVIPLLTRRIWGNFVACIMAALLAVSPVVIFYSRIMRPYAPVMLLAMSSILLTLAWLKGGKRRDILFSALCGAFAIYYHLYAAIPVGMPFIVALVATIKPVGQRLRLMLESKTPFTDICIAGSIFAIIDGVLVVIPNLLNPWWSHGIHGVDRANWQTVVTVSSLISGTRNPFLMPIIIALLLGGLVLMVRQSRTIGFAIVSSFVLFTLIMAKTTQEGAHAGIQVARYGITFLPLAFIAIAVALACLGEYLSEKYIIFQRKQLLLSVALVAWLPFLATSPLWTIYSAPNNFTNQSAYQYRYDPIKWQERSPERDLALGVSMAYSDIPQFYKQSELLKTAKGVIEYPMMIGDHFNLYYYYQHFHRLPVVAGFVSNNNYVPVEPGRDFVFGNWSIDSVMTGMPKQNRNKMSWRTMTDLNDISLLRSRYKGWALVIHRDHLSEVLLRDSYDVRMSADLVDMMIKVFGAPQFMDVQLAAWLIK